jgi:ribose-phosphate pyrophosphokinase
METVAQTAAKLAGAEVGKVAWKSFEDGWPNLYIEDVSQIQGADVTFLASLMKPAELFAQYALMCALPRYGAHSLKVVVPYFPTATMERVEDEGQVATAKSLARLLSTIPMTASGPAQVAIFDIHALAERFFFGDGVVPRMLSLMPELTADLKPDKITIAFPDAGAQKRYGRVFPGFAQVICHKDRVGDRREVRIIEGNPKDCDVVIIDDLVKTGGTLIQCRNVLMKAGARSVSVSIVHPVFPEESWRKFTPDLFREIRVMDTCPETSKLIDDVAPFKVASMASALARIISE